MRAGLLLALAWAVLVVVWRVRVRRPAPIRVYRLRTRTIRTRVPAASLDADVPGRPGRGSRRIRSKPPPAIPKCRPGSRIRDGLDVRVRVRPGRSSRPTGRQARSDRRERARRLATVAAVAVATAVLFMVARPLVLMVPLGLWVWPRVRVRRARQRALDAVEAELPEVVDLLRLAVGAGATVRMAIESVGRRADGAVAGALAAAVEAADERGRRLADALDDVPHVVGEPARALASTLAASERYGHAIGPALERLAGECRDRQRRRAEAAARRVPVLLLFPLVLCILPAFALLTVAPLIAGALRALRL